jgi:ISXO2-like transposase domain
LSSPTQDKTTKMVGIVEADETFFTESCKRNKHLTHRKPRKRGKSSKNCKKGRVPVLIVRDRTGTVADFVFNRIQKGEMHNALKPLMGDEVVLCSDGNSIYQTFAKSENIPHKRIVGIDKVFVVDKIFHIQNLNSYISRLKSWMAIFHGVSIKNLTQYFGWRRLLEKNKQNISGEYFLLQALRKIDQQLTQT